MCALGNQIIFLKTNGHIQRTYIQEMRAGGNEKVNRHTQRATLHSTNHLDHSVDPSAHAAFELIFRQDDFIPAESNRYQVAQPISCGRGSFFACQEGKTAGQTGETKNKDSPET